MTAYLWKISNSTEWKRLRRRIFNARGMTCEDCGRVVRPWPTHIRIILAGQECHFKPGNAVNSDFDICYPCYCSATIQALSKSLLEDAPNWKCKFCGAIGDPTSLDWRFISNEWQHQHTLEDGHKGWTSAKPV